VLDRAVIRKHVLLGAGSLVPEGKVLESGYLYLGRPAKQVRPLTADEIAYFAYSARHYVALAHSYR
jgi:carbonic anhydrase/acetyltransferase-like protein (isoleucine patch superfamily)